MTSKPLLHNDLVSCNKTHTASSSKLLDGDYRRACGRLYQSQVSQQLILGSGNIWWQFRGQLVSSLSLCLIFTVIQYAIIIHHMPFLFINDPYYHIIICNIVHRYALPAYGTSYEINRKNPY
ncbi:hypothetical protein O6H91_09G108700 [Diphasiastrum complanatum]|uniref:Uncharacterized protein n=1 Tax=Diphasiastrum complanatum TaxID=34168 RepID=A0ACC2CSZ6_DIPCM|nr:hypothetical protein O6H91_09G108700 [Diphasiastrum complanatum]